MPTRGPSRRALALAAIGAYALVFAVFALYERPGLGLSHLYYFAVVLAALAGGTGIGALRGLLAFGLNVLDVLVCRHLPGSILPTAAMAVRGTTYVAMGSLVGSFAARNRRLVEELGILADRDAATGLPNTRAFEAAIERRLAAAR